MYLVHHGIKGQKWGVRRFQNPDGTLTSEGRKRYSKEILKKSKVSNLDTWGKQRDKNILFITGRSGSGKSTIAENFNKNSNTIHLDYYFEMGNPKEDKIYQDKEFNSFLKSKGFAIQNLHDKSDIKKFGKALSDFENYVDEFGKQQYGKKKVVVEGVQLLDDTMFPDKNYFNNKPMIIAQTNNLSSAIRANKRDGISPLDIETLKIRMQYSKVWNAKLKELEKSSNTVKIGKGQVDRIMSKWG